MELIIAATFTFAFIAFLITLISIAQGFVLATLWGWFVVPLFHLPELSIPFAIGITLVKGSISHYSPTDEDSKKAWINLASLFVRYGMLLLVGYIVKTNFI